MNPTRLRVFGYVVPILAIVVLVVLLTATLMRLAAIQREMNNNTHANLPWVVYQAHVESLRLGSTLAQRNMENVSSADIKFRYQMLLSRVRLLEAGPQTRSLEEIEGYSDLTEYAAAIQSFYELMDQDEFDIDLLPALQEAVDALSALLAPMSGKVMMAYWDEAGERNDSYRNAVLTLIFLMVGIWISCAFISVQLLAALKKARESEYMRRRKLELQKELENERKISDLYRSFGSMVSHQFRTPLAVIDASMQRLIRGGSRFDADEVARRAERVRAATQRLTHLIDTILNADRFLDQLEVNIQTCSFADLALQAIAEQRLTTPERRIRFSNQCGDESAVQCDPVLTVEILTNFLSNAVKYSSDDSVIDVIINRHESYIRCQVRDQGRGIAAEDLPHIFQRYFRAWTASDVVGSGIGLYIASELALLQDGKVHVSSELGVGSTFELSLPGHGAAPIGAGSQNNLKEQP